MIVDIGAGSNPFPDADVLVDKYLYTGEYIREVRDHRTQDVVADERTIRADIYDLPFKDKQFRFSVCRKVLENIKNVHRALKELERVSLSGYITIPTIYWGCTGAAGYNKWMGYVDKKHRLWILRNYPMKRILKRTVFMKYLLQEMNEGRELLEWQKHLGYYWQGAIDFKVLRQ